MTGTYIPATYLGFAFATIELVLFALVFVGLRAVLLGRDVIWECRWQWPFRLAAAYAQARTSESARLTRWYRRGQEGVTMMRAWSGPSGVLRSAIARRDQQYGARRPVRRHYQTVGARMASRQQLGRPV